MIARDFFAVFGAGLGLAVVAGPALAADDIEAKVQMCVAWRTSRTTPTRARSYRSAKSSWAIRFYLTPIDRPKRLDQYPFIRNGGQ